MRDWRIILILLFQVFKFNFETNFSLTRFLLLQVITEQSVPRFFVLVEDFGARIKHLKFHY